MELDVKILTLIRHAKSSWKDPGLTDFERPLNKRGKRDAPAMAERLKRRSLKPDLILCSSARRARDTIQLIAKTIGYATEHISYEEDLYMAGAFDLVAHVQGIEDRHGHVALCGHNPGISEAIPLLARANPMSIPTCGIVQIEFKVERWADVAAVKGDLLWFDYPKNDESAS